MILKKPTKFEPIYESGLEIDDDWSYEGRSLIENSAGKYDLFKLENALEAMKSDKNNPSKLAAVPS